MNFKHTYRVSPTEPIIIDGNHLDPSHTYHMGVTMFGKHYLGVQSEKDCRIVRYTKLTKDELTKFIRKENDYD